MFGSNDDHRRAQEGHIAQNEEARTLVLAFGSEGMICSNEDHLPAQEGQIAQEERLALETVALLGTGQRLCDNNEALALELASATGNSEYDRLAANESLAPNERLAAERITLEVTGQQRTEFAYEQAMFTAISTLFNTSAASTPANSTASAIAELEPRA